MKSGLKKCWRDSSSLIVLAKSSVSRRKCANYDILLQTRGSGASTFANSVVFPGGVTEPSDGNPEWVNFIRSFGFSQEHFSALHRPGAPLTPIFQDDPVQRHVSLRITAIREAFEELGILICTRARPQQKTGLWADFITDFDVRQWQKKVSKNPEELFNLCRQLNCYPDVWSLHYWSNWLTPNSFDKRFDTAFFVTAFKDKPERIEGSNEVVNVEWSSPCDILGRSSRGEVLLFPPQTYEFHRLSQIADIEQLVQFARSRSALGNDLLYPVWVQATDGLVQLLPGDDLYPRELDDYNKADIHRDSTVLELRDKCNTLHRIEHTNTRKEFIIHNYTPTNHISLSKVMKIYNTVN